MKFKTTVSSEIRDKALNEGIEQGKVSNLVNNIISLMDSLLCDVEEAMGLLKIDQQIRDSLLSKICNSSKDV